MANEELENLETAPKKKRGRPSKAELAERERLKKLSEEKISVIAHSFRSGICGSLRMLRQ